MSPLDYLLNHPEQCTECVCITALDSKSPRSQPSLLSPPSQITTPPKSHQVLTYYTPEAFSGPPSATKPHAALTEANACASSLESGGELVVINHRAPPSQ
ncbi:hypothetical protein CROQUDRAFT_96091 [Cronartium quercuum f. sp. fusiforme G11]|uniref:Uncharacterized protein n=1 Tax=Cronartium quercuum f. sp. fusiforme G11 TaxID=708437 RepID=A0A9P6NBJ2_9BASI|nr:hypothetical protein CROQUDRAFT_96091 [Cronartium quercuum f. sp. fusiforme G11]